MTNDVVEVLGNFSERGAGPAIPPSMAAPSKRRRRERVEMPYDPTLDRELKGQYALLKSKGGRGRYPTRRIANVAHGLVHPGRAIDRDITDALLADVPVERVEEIGWIWVRRVRTVAARLGKAQRPARDD